MWQAPTAERGTAPGGGRAGLSGSERRLQGMSCLGAPARRVDVWVVGVNPEVIGVTPAIEVELYPMVLHVLHTGHAHQGWVPAVHGLQFHVDQKAVWGSHLEGPGGHSRCPGFFQILLPTEAIRVWVVLWRGEGLSLLLAPAHRVDVGAAGVTPETENASLSQGPLRTRTARPQCPSSFCCLATATQMAGKKVRKLQH